MEDSFKGAIVTATIILIFMTGIFGFITEFPSDQNMIFNEKDNETYLVMENLDTQGASSQLQQLTNTTDDGFNQWDIEVGFMGSNAQKGSESSGGNYAYTIYQKLTIVADQLFDKNNPISWALGILGTLMGLYITYVFIKFIRTGN